MSESVSPPTPARVFVAGRGLVCGLGSDVPTTMDALFEGRTALRTVSLAEAPPFPLARCEDHPGNDDDPTGVVALALRAAEEAWNEARRCGAVGEATPVELIVASTKGDLTGVLPADRADEAQSGWGNVGRFAEAVERAVRGASWFAGEVTDTTAISCACASGLAALAEAGRRLRTVPEKSVRQKSVPAETVRTETVLVVAADRLSSFMVRGFEALLALDPEPCRPFDRSRRGLSLGEGAGAMVLTRDANRSLGFELESWGASNDANHITGPSRTGAGLALAIDRALSAVPGGAGSVDAVHLHGTGTDYNDASEIEAIGTVFPESSPLLFGTKGQTGHTLGAAGVIESLVALEALLRGEAPGNARLETVDAPERMRLTQERTPLARRNVGRVLKVAAGFGGVNVALVWTDRRDRAEEMAAALPVATAVEERSARASAHPPTYGILDDDGLRGTAFDLAERAPVPLAELRDTRGRWRWSFERPFPEFRRLDGWSRVVALVSEAAREIHSEPDGDAARTGLVLGTTLGCLASDLRFQASLAPEEQTASRLFPYTLPSAALAPVAIRHQLQGPTVALTTTHGHELRALEIAWRWLECGEVDRVHLVLGDDAGPDDVRRAGFDLRTPRAVAMSLDAGTRGWFEREAGGVTRCVDLIERLDRAGSTR